MAFKKILPVLLLMAFYFAGLAGVSAQTTPDPGTMGTHTVLKGEYNLGDAYYAAIPPYMNHTMECRGLVYYPSDLTSGPFPVLFWLHGRHETCYDPTTLNTTSDWPCPAGDSPIVSYEGYNYAAITMASQGYIVISISANAINAWDGVSGYSSDDGMTARGMLMEYHMNLWNGWNTTDTTGPFGATFVGRLNMQNIGTMGHSRGGEGAIDNYLYNASLGSPYGIKAVLTLAPTDFFRNYINNVPMLDVAPYCDGDVNDLEGLHYYDDARYAVPNDLSPKHTLLVMGADHDLFNTVWTPAPSYPAGGVDDWTYSYSENAAWCGTNATGSGRLDSTEQKAVYNTYAAAFYRLYIGKETQFAPILTVNDLIPPASAMVNDTQVFMSYHAGYEDRLDINTQDTVFDVTLNTLVDSVRISSSFTSPEICGGGLAQPNCDPGLSEPQVPHNGTGSQKGLGQMKLTWSDTPTIYDNDIPAAYENFTKYEAVTFRACENFKETTSGPDLNFSVELVDSAGDSSAQAIDTSTYAMFFQPGTQSGDLPKEVFNTLRIPMSGFTGVNLAKIRHLRFKFNKSASGAILISDLALTNAVCGNFTSSFTDTFTHTLHKIGFVNGSTSTISSDTISYLWNFGDPSSGVNDTSTAKNPSHTYTGSGAPTVCLVVTDRRLNGLTCTDTFCKTISVPASLGVPGITEPSITIFPNPAKNYIQVSGANSTDVLRLTNLYGQEVFTTTISQPIIDLPPTLANGLYYVIVTTPMGNAYQKLVIVR